MLVRLRVTICRIVPGIVPVQYIEIVEVPACGPTDDDFLSFHVIIFFQKLVHPPGIQNDI